MELCWSSAKATWIKKIIYGLKPILIYLFNSLSCFLGPI